MPRLRERDVLAAWENEGGAVGELPERVVARPVPPGGGVMDRAARDADCGDGVERPSRRWLARLRDALHRKLRGVREPVSAARRELRAGRPILCGECGVSEQSWFGACARCGGYAWVGWAAAHGAPDGVARNVQPYG